MSTNRAGCSFHILARYSALPSRYDLHGGICFLDAKISAFFKVRICTSRFRPCTSWSLCAARQRGSSRTHAPSQSMCRHCPCKSASTHEPSLPNFLLGLHIEMRIWRATRKTAIRFWIRSVEHVWIYMYRSLGPHQWYLDTGHGAYVCVCVYVLFAYVDVCASVHVWSLVLVWQCTSLKRGDDCWRHGVYVAICCCRKCPECFCAESTIEKRIWVRLLV